MQHKRVQSPGRRALLRAGLFVPAAIGLERVLPGSGRALAATPACEDDEPTPSLTAGPFYKPRSPERASLIEAGAPGTRMALRGRVLSTRCAPVPRALIDVWHADAAGDYDNAGYRCRGHQFADDQGRFAFETVVPGSYPGRTRHFHVRVQAPGRPILTTQLFFPGEPTNAGDFLFREELLLAVQDLGSAKSGRFDFVVELG
jgi:protocatechuate 3,4-dioxygenase beta subunit